MRRLLVVIALALGLSASSSAVETSVPSAATPPRARDLGIPFEGTPGEGNAITDVKGVEVGHTTLIAGDGKLKIGAGPVRTGVTAILPRGRQSSEATFAGWFSLNGNGEMTGTTWVEESGMLDGPILITNTHSVGIVRDSIIKYQEQHSQRTSTNGASQFFWSLPVVAETYDGKLNDINGFHVKEKHVFAALDGARAGRVAEGNVGGGTGMICYEWKGGIGTSSRKLADKNGGYTVGVLVQCNCGAKEQLRVAGVPVGRELGMESSESDGGAARELGSIIITIATDAPLLPTQLKRLARRASMGLARTGSISGNGSGDIFIAFSTAHAQPSGGLLQLAMLPNDRINNLFEATVQATEEAIVNALVAAQTMTGINGYTVTALPHDRLKQVLKKFNRLETPLGPKAPLEPKATAKPR